MKLPRLPELDHAIARVTTRSVLNPLLWLCGIVTPLGLILASAGDEAIRAPMLLIACAPILFIAVAYTYFAVREPDRLQSEEHIQELQRIKHLGDSEAGEAGPGIVIEHERIERPANFDDDRGVKEP